MIPGTAMPIPRSSIAIGAALGQQLVDRFDDRGEGFLGGPAGSGRAAAGQDFPRRLHQGGKGLGSPDVDAEIEFHILFTLAHILPLC